MVTRSKLPSSTSSRPTTDLRVIAFNRNRQLLLRQLGMLLLFGLSLLNTLMWKGVPPIWLMVDMGLTLLAGSWVLSRYYSFGSKGKSGLGSKAQHHPDHTH